MNKDYPDRLTVWYVGHFLQHSFAAVELDDEIRITNKDIGPAYRAMSIWLRGVTGKNYQPAQELDYYKSARKGEGLLSGCNTTYGEWVLVPTADVETKP